MEDYSRFTWDKNVHDLSRVEEKSMAGEYEDGCSKCYMKDYTVWEKDDRRLSHRGWKVFRSATRDSYYKGYKNIVVIVGHGEMSKEFSRWWIETCMEIRLNRGNISKKMMVILTSISQNI